VESAAFINTSMIRNFDFNDRYPGGHPSDCLGALLAIAGAMDIDGERFLASMIVAYEIFARLSDATALSRRGWDQGYAIGIATGAGVCNLLNIAPAATAHAVGIVAASNLPLRVTRSGELTPWKNAATAYATRNGVFAALLAAEGMSGPSNAFEGCNGLFEKVTGPFELAPLPNRVGAHLTPRVQLKYWPSKPTASPRFGPRSSYVKKLRSKSSNRSMFLPPSSPGSRSVASLRNRTRRHVRPRITACLTSWPGLWWTGRSRVNLLTRTRSAIPYCDR
jgi:MmgE/PrpD N-terminal domain